MKSLFAFPLLSLLVACSAPSNDAQTEDNDIVGGVAATGSAIAAINGIRAYNAAGEYSGGCTSTLIASDLLITAKHCVLTSASDPNAQTWLAAGGKIELNIGPSWETPSRVVKASAVETCALKTGGSAGLGCDVALIRLSEKVTDIAPLAIGTTPLTEAEVGTTFTAVGYGTTNAANDWWTSGTRNMATLTLRAVTGPAMHSTYATFQEFIDALDAVEGPGFHLQWGSYWQSYYDRPLLQDYEVLAGGGSNEAQDCHGDSGSPLLRNVDGKLVVYGVASTVVSGKKQVCENMGTFYAALGPEAQSMIDTALHDPCAGATASGRCDGDVAVRCSRADEGPRRALAVDCSRTLQHCIAPSSANAIVACGDVP